MRTVAALISLTLLAPVAAAAPGAARPPARTSPAPTTAQPAPSAPAAAKTPAVNLTPINLTETPERCHPIAKRAASANLVQALSARISLAGCISDATFSELTLIDGSDSVTALDEAVVPSLAMLDEVVAAAADPVTRVMATHAKVALYQNMMNRMVQTVPSTDASPDAQALKETRRQIVQGLLAPWRETQMELYGAIDEIAKAHPTIIRNPVALAAIRDSREQLAARPVAAVTPPASNEPEAPADTKAAPEVPDASDASDANAAN